MSLSSKNRERLVRQRRQRIPATSLSGDNGYHTRRFVECLQGQHIAAHVAINGAHFSTGPDGRTLDSPG